MEAEEREAESEGVSYFRSGGSSGGLFLTELIILSEGAGLETGGCDRPNGRRHPFANHPSRAATSPPSTAVKHLPYGAAWQPASLCVSTGGERRRCHNMLTAGFLGGVGGNGRRSRERRR